MAQICEVCRRTPFNDGIALHRVNEKGVEGIWRCFTCLTPEQRDSLDPVLEDIADILGSANIIRNEK